MSLNLNATIIRPVHSKKRHSENKCPYSVIIFQKVVPPGTVNNINHKQYKDYVALESTMIINLVIVRNLPVPAAMRLPGNISFNCFR